MSVNADAAMNPLYYVCEDECGSGGGAINGIFGLLLLLALGMAIGIGNLFRVMVAYASFVGLWVFPLVTLSFFWQGKDATAWKSLLASVICYGLLKWAMYDKAASSVIESAAEKSNDSNESLAPTRLTESAPSKTDGSRHRTICEKTDRTVHGRCATPSMVFDGSSASNRNSIAAYVSAHNNTEIERLLTPGCRQPGDRSNLKGDKQSESVTTKAPVPLSKPVKGFVPLIQCGKHGSLLTDGDIKDFGAKLVYFIECDAHRVYWDKGLWDKDFGLLQRVGNDTFENEIEEFGDELVNLTFRAAEQFLLDCEQGFPSPFQRSESIIEAKANFGYELLLMTTKVMTHVFAKRTLEKMGLPLATPPVLVLQNVKPQAAKRREQTKKPVAPRISEPAPDLTSIRTWDSPFIAGSMVIHRKNSNLGSGMILKINAQYLTVSFPAKDKEFELLTATAEEFLALTPK